MQSFKEIGLSDELLKAIEELGFETPTPVQEKAIPEILNNGNDVVSLAQTGTGKTGAFGLPVIQLADLGNSDVQALVLCPTRELCLQITKDLTAFAKFRKGLNVTPVYGGSDIRTQIRALRNGSHIVVGTPGRVNDLLDRSVLKINNIKWLILDEADEMLNMGFKDDLETILSQTPDDRQTLLFSATMPPQIANIAKHYMKNPIEIKIGKTNQGADTVEHYYYMVHASDRYLALKRVVDINPDIYGIVFCRTRQETKEVADKLMADGYNADALHGDLSQAQRDMVMQRFRIRHLQLLVATDVAARGIDVNELTHVINYNLPDDVEVYIHRSGRTGRAGKKGVSATIIHSREMNRIREIERISGKKFQQKLVPMADEICEKKLLYFVDNLEKQEVNEGAVTQFLPAIYEKLSGFSREQLIEKIVASEFEQFNDYYRNAPDLNVYPQKRDKMGGKQRGNFSRLFINLGKTDRMNAGDLIGIVNNYTRGLQVKIGQIEILKNFSFFEVDSEYANEVVKALDKQFVNGYKLIVEPASAKPSDSRGDRKPGKDRKFSDRGFRGERGDRNFRGGKGERGDGARKERSFEKGGFPRGKSRERGTVKR
jgi:ATP-dependent RNA helicase DeaD